MKIVEFSISKEEVGWQVRLQIWASGEQILALILRDICSSGEQIFPLS